MWARMSSWGRKLPRRSRNCLAVLTLCVVLGGGYYGIREVAQRVADHLTVTVTRVSDEPDGRAGSLVYQATFGRPVAAEAENLLLSDVILNRRRLRTTNGVERLNEEIRRRERVIRIFPNRDSILRHLGALLLEQDEAWTTGHRYLDMTAYWQWRATASQEQEAALPHTALSNPSTLSVKAQQLSDLTNTPVCDSFSLYEGIHFNEGNNVLTIQCSMATLVLVIHPT